MAAVRSELERWRLVVRERDAAYVPAYQGYIVATICRSLFTLETGRQTSKEKAVAWMAERRPDIADFLWSAYRAYRSDMSARHERLIRFVDEASALAGR
jgi:hypothetical protein